MSDEITAGKEDTLQKEKLFLETPILVYAYGISKNHRIAKAIRRVRAYQKKGGNK